MVGGTRAPVDVDRHLPTPVRLLQIRVQGRDEFEAPLREQELLERGKRRLKAIPNRNLQPREQNLAVATL